MDKRVIRGIYLYEFKLGTTAKEAGEKINAAFGQGCSTIRTAYRWYQKFRNGDESLEGHEGRGRHSDVDEDKLRDVVEEDPHKGTREIAKALGVSHNQGCAEFPIPCSEFRFPGFWALPFRSVFRLFLGRKAETEMGTVPQ
ncbi:unnamed protein product [Heligmosomoides polygyrus]|uniref:HTH_48 domain-containing protein n=1 Tax=Heligmosomoides polygyrus TaxID=6339 RepID=A0A183G3G2_HELPZ|nr:unnamed protein product [Heligmosomoides polygyrus]